MVKDTDHIHPVSTGGNSAIPTGKLAQYPPHRIQEDDVLVIQVTIPLKRGSGSSVPATRISQDCAEIFYLYEVPALDSHRGC